MRRAEEDKPDHAQNATLVLTIRALDDKLPVYNGIPTITQISWVVQPIDNHLRLRP